MANDKLFTEFEKVSSKEWKQKIQVELKGADYNETLVWESLEGIKVKPFYGSDEFEKKYSYSTPSNPFKIGQKIFVHEENLSVKNANEFTQKGADAIYFTIPNEEKNIDALLAFAKTKTAFFYLPFLSNDFVSKFNAIENATLLIDPIGQLVLDGNWFTNLESDFKTLNQLNKNCKSSFLTIKSEVYQNAGANMVQQLAYTLAHVNEYFNRIETIQQKITVEVAVGSNYFFEIAKLKALRLLLETLAKEYNFTAGFQIIATPTKRNKTLYDYNVNMLRTTTECMSAILGGADVVINSNYDAIYHKENEFGNRIARNQLLVLKNESYFDKVNNATDGAYYIETLTEQLAEKALELFKDIEANGGLITQLIEGTIQRKIKESADKEQELFDNGKEILLGTNKYPNKNDQMKNDLELYPFVKQNPRKTLITPVIERRLAEKLEQERLSQEQ